MFFVDKQINVFPAIFSHVSNHHVASSRGISSRGISMIPVFAKTAVANLGSYANLSYESGINILSMFPFRNDVSEETSGVV